MFNKAKPRPKKFNLHRTFSSGVNSKNNYALAAYGDNNANSTPRFAKKKIFLIIFSLLLAPLLIIAVWDYRNFSKASGEMFNNSNGLGVLAVKPLQDEDKRVNILLVGYSADDPGHGGAELTDTIMLLSLDKYSKTGYMLSIPRDLYIEIPGYGRAKINEAFQSGKKSQFAEAGYSSGGMGLLEKVISENFDLKIHYNFLINYGAVKQVVDALDGITVDITSPDPRGIYDPNFKPEEGGPLQLPNGKQTINGQTALRLNRARGSTPGSYGFPQSDFNRTQNQQAVLSAIKAKASWTLVLNPIKNAKIFDAAAQNIETNLKLSELLPFYRLINQIPDEDLVSIGLHDINGQNLLRSYQTPSGQSALIPSAGLKNYSEIQRVIRGLNQ